MVFPYKHSYLVLEGTVAAAGGTDRWQTGVRIATNGAPAMGDPGVDTAAVLTRVSTVVTTFWNAIKAGYNGNVALTGFRLNGIGPDGKYLHTTTYAAAIGAASGLPGTGAGASLPSQLAIAMTLSTAIGRGRASKGRMYLPAGAVGEVGSDGSILIGRRDVLRPALATLLTALGDWSTVSASSDLGQPAVMSNIGTGIAHAITGVSVGNRYDVQRRRANALPDIKGAVSTVG